MRYSLPLLFVNGYPTSLNKMTVPELERFIPFMVQCSLGHDKINIIGTPNWWPKEIPYPKAFVKYNKNDINWNTKLRNLVQLCYSFHKCDFLLRFCSNLAKYPKASLRFMNNCDGTTSLFHKGTGKLLVTFRNENVSYDKIIPVRKRKWLKPQNSQTSASWQMFPAMVEEDPVDIYLCDNCDAVLHSSKEMKEHEETCLPENEDVRTISPESIMDGDQDNFLQYFALSTGTNNKVIPATPNSPARKKRPTRSSIPHQLIQSASIPFSSPAGIFLTKRSRHSVTNETHTERRERTERYCEAPALCNGTPSWLQENPVVKTYAMTYRKQRQSWIHEYHYPKTLSKHVLDVESQMKFMSCKPCSVSIPCTCKLFSPTPIIDVIDLCSSDEDDVLREKNSFVKNKHI